MQISGSFLPNDLLQEILCFLPGEDLARSLTVCTAFKKSASETVWKDVLIREYPILLLSTDPKEQYKALKQKEILQRKILFQPAVCMGPPPPPKFPPFDNLDHVFKKINKLDKLEKLCRSSFQLENRLAIPDIKQLIKKIEFPVISLDLKAIKEIELLSEKNVLEDIHEPTFSDQLIEKIDTVCQGVLNFFNPK